VSSEPVGSPPRRRGLVVAAAVLVILLIAFAAVTFMPRTIASGGSGQVAWEVRAAPGLTAPMVRVVSEQGTIDLEPTGTDLSGSVVLGLPEAGATTVTVGPVPREAQSVRITAEDVVTEAEIRRVAWRRVHVAVHDGPLEVREMVAIGEHGQIVEVVHDPPRR
jgi:hypothetical protein